MILAWSGQRPVSDALLRFLGHFAAISDAIDGQSIWDEADGLYYDRLLVPDGIAVPLKVRSMLG